MQPALRAILESIHTADMAARPTHFIAQPIPEYGTHYIGWDHRNAPTVLIHTSDRFFKAPLQLAAIEVQYATNCSVRLSTGDQNEKVLTVVTCTSPDRVTQDYFLYLVETVLRIVGRSPSLATVTDAIIRLAHIFQRLQKPPTRSVNGLFGELFLIRQSLNPVRSLMAWRTQDTSRFDFNAGNIRIDVKTASGRQRIHTFSYDQCNPPFGTIAVAASLFVEQTAGGSSLQEIIREIEALVAPNAKLVLKLHDTVAETLGRELSDALSIIFDYRLSESSLQFYDLRSIPAVRDQPPPGVFDIHFRSDLSSTPQSDFLGLVEREPTLLDFLPANT